MLYSSRDIESTGTDRHKNQILSIWIIIEDTNKKLSFEQIPKFHWIITRKEIYWNLVAIEMNIELIKDINAYLNHWIPYLWFWKFHKDEEDLVAGVRKFLMDNKLSWEKLNIAGKNFWTFDKLFLEKLPWRDIQFSNRIIDPAALYVNWDKDECLPNLSECKARAWLPNTISHNALEDARDVVQVLRKKYL